MTGRAEAERAFYDARAATVAVDPARMALRPPDPYDLAILGALGDLRGRELLELGCGEGDLTLELLARGARITATDISPQSVELARRRIAHHAPRAAVQLAAAPAEQLPYPDDSFDAVTGKWVIHHADVPRAAAEIARVLRPGGLGVFFENHDRNPVLRHARRRLLGVPGVDRVGTPDERPLSAADIEVIAGHFSEVEQAFPTLYLFELLSRQVLRYRLFHPLQRLDAALHARLPAIRPHGYHVLLILRP